MFVRFRRSAGDSRLTVSLVRTQRRGATVVSTHVAALGSIANWPEPYDRYAFWLDLQTQLGHLRTDGTVAPEDLPALLDAVERRIPLPQRGEIDLIMAGALMAQQRRALAEGTMSLAEAEAVGERYVQRMRAGEPLPAEALAAEREHRAVIEFGIFSICALTHAGQGREMDEAGRGQVARGPDRLGPRRAMDAVDAGDVA